MPGDVPGSANNCSGYFTGSEDPGTGLPGNGLVTNNYSGYYPRRSFRPDLPGRPINPNNSSGCFPVRRCAPVSPGFFLSDGGFPARKPEQVFAPDPPQSAEVNLRLVCYRKLLWLVRVLWCFLRVLRQSFLTAPAQ